MKTYEELATLGEAAAERAAFVRSAVDEFRGSKEYRVARDAEAYYAKHNVTIEAYQKFIYTMSGGKVKDVWSSDYRLKSAFFRRLVVQQVQFLLGNGVNLPGRAKKKLGKKFDKAVQNAAKRAMINGQAFGFWNYDHLEVFGFADTPVAPGFCPLYSSETSQLMAGIRFWFKRVGDDVIFRATLYEADGITEYVQKNNDAVRVMDEKHGYIRTVAMTQAAGVEDISYENYSALPIFPIYANDTHESELVGVRECIDAYDFVKSGLANNIDDASGFYWLVKNSGGMNDKDLAQLVQRLKTVRAAAVDSDDGGAIEGHTMEIPIEARDRMLEILRSDIYEDFMLADMKSLSAAQKTAQEIQAAYQAQENKVDDFEYLVTEFIERILAFVGIDEEPTYTRQRVTNRKEETDMVLSYANYLSPECIISHCPFLTPEEANEEINKYENEQVDRFSANIEDEDEDEETDEE